MTDIALSLFIDFSNLTKKNLPLFLVHEYVECNEDAECGPGLACLQGTCNNPCDSTSCGVRAVCRVTNTLPFRTLVCECPSPLTGDASVQCNPSKYFVEQNTKYLVCNAYNILSFQD